jgi:hypothetical protein
MGPASTTASTLSASAPISSLNTDPTLIKQLPANIPCLEPNGTNWAIFFMRFKEVMQASHHWHYFDGSSKHPSPKDDIKPTEEEIKALET